jgi:hypothetical protein
MKQRLALVPVVAVAALAAAATGAGSSAPQQLVVSFPGYVYSLGGGGGRIGWIDTGFSLRLRSITSSTVASIHYTNTAHEFPNYPPALWQRRLVINRSGELWWSTTNTHQFVNLDRVLFAARGAANASTLLKASHSYGGDGDFVAGIAGDAGGFAYGEVVVDATTPDQVAYHVVGGGVFSVDARGKPTKLPGVAPAYLFARGAGLVVVEPVATDVNESAALRPSNMIEIRNVNDGSLVQSLSVAGVRAAAVNQTTVALLVGRRLRRYRISDRSQLGSTTLPSSTAQELETDGTVAVARSSQAILVVNLATGRLRSLAVPAPWHPTGVAIVGGTLVWSESHGQTLGDPSSKTFTTRILSTKLAGLR